MEWESVQHANRVIITNTQPESIQWNSWCSGSTATAGTLWPTANRAIFVPFVTYRPFIVDRMAVINGNAVSGNIDVGIYDSEGNKMVANGAGTAQSGTTAIQSFNLTDTVIGPGIYYMGCVLDNGTGRLVGFTEAVTIQRAYGVLSMSTAYGLPDPVTFAAAADAFHPSITVYGRSVV